MAPADPRAGVHGTELIRNRACRHSRRVSRATLTSAWFAAAALGVLIVMPGIRRSGQQPKFLMARDALFKTPS